MTSGAKTTKPLHIAHVVYRLDVGGLENGVVNLINGLPREQYRHSVVCLTDYTEFRRRIQAEAVQFYSLTKRPGKDLALYGRLWSLFRKLRPDVVHTRNLATLEAQLPAALAGVRHRIHGEHGWDVHDIDGSNPRYLKLRRLMRHMVSRYVPLSRELERYLRTTVGVPQGKIIRICNGVDTKRFTPRVPGVGRKILNTLAPPGTIVFGTVGRMEEVKDQVTLARAFVRLVQLRPEDGNHLRLAMIGDGALRPAIAEMLKVAGLSQLAWLPGARDDIPGILRDLDVFVLPSMAEGISNTLLEAAATGLPAIATRVGGNPEVVEPERTGLLVPPGDAESLARAMARYLDEPELGASHGANARAWALVEFSLPVMVSAYHALYQEIVAGTAVSTQHSVSSL